MQRGGQGLAHPPGDLGRLLVAARCGGGELLLDGLDMTVELHRDVTMTSSVPSVKLDYDIATPSVSRHMISTASGDYRFHTSPRRMGVAAPLASTPSTSTSGPPIMKSVWTPETFTPSPRSRSPGAGSASADGIPDPNAMWQVAFSSKSVSQNVSPVRFTAEVPSTRATSPRYGACSSTASCSRMISPPLAAVTSVMRPCSNRTARSETRVPPVTSGFVDRTTPSARRQSGVVTTSSVGML